MSELLTGVNWPAVLLGTVLAFGLGMIWFSPRMFGRIWSAGSHNIQPPARLPLAAMAIQLAGTFLMAWLVGITAVNDLLLTALLVILTIAVLQVGAGLFAQKSPGAALVDGGYVVMMGALMIAAQGLL
jgi:hypothetical protein